VFTRYCDEGQASQVTRRGRSTPNVIGFHVLLSQSSVAAVRQLLANHRRELAALHLASMRLVPNPGVLPTRPSPKTKERIEIRLSGMPPYKQLRCSLRNPAHRDYGRFVKLRNVATKAMRGRRWTDNGVEVRLTVHAPSPEIRSGKVADYLGGVLDTLDGSHGDGFTYLPIIFQDDCQVCKARYEFKAGPRAYYVVRIDFLG
jgi:hypothetical protein